MPLLEIVMDLINEPIIDRAKRKHADARDWLTNWCHEVRSGSWRNPDAVRKLYARASILPDNRVVFRVKGNRYRLIVQIDYRKGIVVAIFFGTHEEYDEFNAREA